MISEETREKLRVSHLGHKHSEETRQKMSESHKGKNTWSKGKKISEEHRQKIIKNRLKNYKHSDEVRAKISLSKKGKKRPEISGEKCYLWKGGINPINLKIRKSLEMKMWREAVFTRDNWTCVLCLKVGGDLNADHIKQFAFYPELRFDIENGRTLCVPCHRKTPTYSNKNAPS